MPKSSETIVFTKQIAIQLNAEQEDLAKWQCYMLTDLQNDFVTRSWAEFETTGRIINARDYDKYEYPKIKNQFVDPQGRPLFGQARQMCLRQTMLKLKRCAYGYKRHNRYIRPKAKPELRNFATDPYRSIHFPNTFKYVRLIGDNIIHLPFFKETRIIDNDYVKPYDLLYITGGDVIWDFDVDRWYLNLHMEVPSDYFKIHHPIPSMPDNDPGCGIDLGFCNLVTRVGAEKHIPLLDDHPNVFYTKKIRHLEERINALKRRIRIKEDWNLRRYGFDPAERTSKGSTLVPRVRDAGLYNAIFRSNNIIKLYRKIGRTYRKLRNYRRDLRRKIARAIIVQHPKFIAMEHLWVEKMVSKVINFNNPKMRRANTHVPYYSLREDIHWQCIKYGIPFIYVPENQPTSKICAICGRPGGITRYQNFSCQTKGCPVHKIHRNRDENAAENIYLYGISEYESIPLPQVYTNPKFHRFAKTNKCRMTMDGIVTPN